MQEALSPANAAVLETFVVPRYLTLFGTLVEQMLLVGESARVAHLGCRTGYPDVELARRHPGVSVVGVDASQAALELARHKAVSAGVTVEYVEARALPTPLPASSFSHVISLHPTDRLVALGTMKEAVRLLYGGGQLLLALPLRGSFQELGDLLREYALKHDDGALGEAVEVGFSSRSTIETLSDELEALGFDDVDVEVRATELGFDSGRAFVEDPAARLLILPELQGLLGVERLEAPLDYLREAIDKYWSESRFDLTLHVGCASARVPL